MTPGAAVAETTQLPLPWAPDAASQRIRWSRESPDRNAMFARFADVRFSDRLRVDLALGDQRRIESRMPDSSYRDLLIPAFRLRA